MSNGNEVGDFRTMRYRGHFLPRINELTAFAAAARHSNFTRAAVELSLTQGAVSRAIAELEGREGAESEPGDPARETALEPAEPSQQTETQVTGEPGGAQGRAR